MKVNNIENKGEFFMAQKFGRFIDDVCFKSPFRCAEHIMRITGKDNWKPLQRMYSVVAVEIDN